ncbi:MAG: efflux RND transporter periplasmic adaptor subunit [Polyangiales bacterium]
MMRFTHGWLVAAALSAGAASGCHHQQHHHAEAPRRLEVTTVIRRDTDITHAYVCQIRAFQHIEVRALERGYLRDIYVDEGQSVRRGHPLFQLTPVIYQAELARSAAEAQRAQVEFQNTRMLREGNVVSQNELALAQASLARATAERSLAQAHLRFSRLDAPFDGIVGRLMARRGSLVSEGDLLTVLADNSQMWVYFNVSEREYLAYRRAHPAGDHAPVRLRLANNEMFAQPGVIQTIEADFNNETGTIAFRAGFPNPDGLLRHGETGEILMETPLPHALIIPQKATYTELDKVFVFVVGHDNVVHAREISVAAERPHQYIIGRGLQEGDRVLIEGLRRVRDGDRITPNMRNPDDVFNEMSHLLAE